MKSIHKAEYRLFCTLLRESRAQAGLSQVSLAATLGVPQAYVSAFELGKVRQDFVQIRDWCAACGITVGRLADTFDARWGAEQAALADKKTPAPRAASEKAAATGKVAAKSAPKAVRKSPGST